MVRLGRIPDTWPGMIVRAMLLLGALYMSVPVERFVGLPMAPAMVLGTVLASAGLGLLYWIGRTKRRDDP